ncbi:MAG: integrase [Robiginitomaculum sp.]|nr:MAG: integrase [Robiginitomaculum sp.]
MPLTNAKLKALKPKAKPYKLADYDGLLILVTPNGSKLWKFKFRINGKEKSLSFGKYPYVSLLQARDMRDAARTNIAQGVDPAALKRERKNSQKAISEHTFAKFADRYLIKSMKEGKSEATLKKTEWILRLAIADIGDMAINNINAQTVLKTLKKREAMGHYETVRRMKSTISAVFRYAVASGVAENDPTFALKDALIRPTTKHRAAITDKTKLKEYLHALENYGGRTETKIGLKLLMLFACRPGEIRKAKWEEFNFEERIWSVPVTRMKMRKPHTVPLCADALALLEQLRTLTGWGDLLFPAQTSAHKPISENTLNQALRRMGFGPEEVTSHGFRSTFSTFANESGLWNPDAIEAYCARQDKNAVRRAYNRSLYWDERVRMADWWADELVQISLK